uniref:Putative DNA repair and recombination protein n=1 Tax=viral metagenome TaxID=1070528 RepID=A0A6M3X667_9ZZZZ
MSEQIEIVDGIIPNTKWTTMQKIVKSGINTVGDLARQTPSQLSEQSGVGQDTCEKYIATALEMISEGVITGEQLWDRLKNRHKLTTGSKAVDEILRSDDDRERGKPGGVEEQTTTEVGGEKGVGKTQLMHVLAVNAQLPYEEGGLGGKVVWIDTENTFRPDRIIQICKARGLDGLEMLRGILYEEVYHSKHQLEIISKLPKLCQEYDIKLIIVDSMIAHLRSEYTGRGMLAERQQLLSDILQRLGKISQNHHLTVIYTNQVMDKPTPYGDPTEAVGGNIMGHASTLRLFIKRGRQGSRVMKVTKSPYLPENEATFLVTEAGIEDTEENIKKLEKPEENEDE